MEKTTEAPGMPSYFEVTPLQKCLLVIIENVVRLAIKTTYV